MGRKKVNVKRVTVSLTADGAAAYNKLKAYGFDMNVLINRLLVKENKQ